MATAWPTPPTRPWPIPTPRTPLVMGWGGVGAPTVGAPPTLVEVTPTPPSPPRKIWGAAEVAATRAERQRKACNRVCHTHSQLISLSLPACWRRWIDRLVPFQKMESAFKVMGGNLSGLLQPATQSSAHRASLAYVLRAKTFATASTLSALRVPGHSPLLICPYNLNPKSSDSVF